VTAERVESREARLERLLREYGAAIARLCAAYERDAADRDDLWQDVAFALWKALDGFRGECSEKTFVYRVARNRVLTHRFRRRHASAPISEAGEVADPRSDPAAAAEASGERERLLLNVRLLPETLRGAVVLRLEGLTDREIADVLGVTVNNVAVRLTRARDMLRRLMAGAAQRGAG
jgi:RNA polymerase sigma-70 factor (ECF subfamily)